MILVRGSFTGIRIGISSIKAIAEEYGLFYIDLVGLIDFNGAYEYMYAGAHPNAAGMEIIGKD